MPVTEYINGIECVFPESKEKSFNQFVDLVKDALYRCAMEGLISLEELKEMTEE